MRQYFGGGHTFHFPHQASSPLVGIETKEIENAAEGGGRFKRMRWSVFPVSLPSPDPI